MVTPASPRDVLVAQASALAVGERVLPFAAPPLSLTLMSVANALPLGSLPALPIPGAAGALPFAIPALPLGSPLGSPQNLVAALGPATSHTRRLPIGLSTHFGRTGLS